MKINNFILRSEDLDVHHTRALQIYPEERVTDFSENVVPIYTMPRMTRP